jgi:RNA recognition motif-containing protein
MGEQVEIARSVLDGSVQVGRAISVRPFQGVNARREPKPEPVPSSSSEDRTLYVGNLPYDATAEEVERVLERAGVTPVLRVHLPVGPDGRPRGFGFVTLSSPDAVMQAIPAMQSAELRGRRVMVKVANPRGAAPRGPAGGPTAAHPLPRQPQGSRPDYSDSPPPPRAYRAPQPSTDFEEEDEGDGTARGSGKTKSVAVARGAKTGKAATNKRKGERVADERRSRGGGASWQRWEDWDDE